MEQKIIFREMLGEIMKLADARDNRLTVKEIDDFFENMHLTKEQMAMVYEYLDSQKVKVSGFEKKGPNRFAQPEEELAEKVPASVDEEDDGETDDGSGETGKGDSRKSDQKAKQGEEEEVPLRSMEIYLDEISQLEQLDTARELELFHLAADGDAAARSRLVERYLPLVCELASEYEGNDYPTEDLIQEGNVGLLLALEQVERQESLAAYQARLMNEVNQYMQDALQDQKDLREMDNGVARRVNHLNEAIRNLEEDLEHRVSVEELSAYLEMPAEEIRDILKMAGDELKVDGYESN